MHCPKCASPKFVNTHSIQFVCGACSFEYFHNTAAAVAGIIQHDGDILMTRRAKNPGLGKWDLPGGFVDPNESLEQAIAREVREELGILINDWRYCASAPNQYLYKDVLYNTLDTLFVVTLEQRSDLTLQTSEITQAAWFSSSEIPHSQIAFPSIKVLLNKYMASL